RDQAEGSVTRVVMRAPLDLAWAHGQKRLGAIERPHLALFVDAQDTAAFGQGKVKADDVALFFDEQGIGRQLEGLGAMRLKAEGFPDSVDRRGRQSDGFGQESKKSRKILLCSIVYKFSPSFYTASTQSAR